MENILTNFRLVQDGWMIKSSNFCLGFRRPHCWDREQVDLLTEWYGRKFIGVVGDKTTGAVGGVSSHHQTNGQISWSYQSDLAQSARPALLHQIQRFTERTTAQANRQTPRS